MSHFASSSQVTSHCELGAQRIVQSLLSRHVSAQRPVVHVNSHLSRPWQVHVGPHSPFVAPGPESDAPASLGLGLLPPASAGGGLLGGEEAIGPGTLSEPIVQS
jgi:hypothetical protein